MLPGILRPACHTCSMLRHRNVDSFAFHCSIRFSLFLKKQCVRLFTGSLFQLQVPFDNQVIGKFSIRIVPNQTPQEVDTLTKELFYATILRIVYFVTK